MRRGYASGGELRGRGRDDGQGPQIWNVGEGVAMEAKRGSIQTRVAVDGVDISKRDKKRFNQRGRRYVLVLKIHTHT